ncbi:MAG TPA: winged helix-turn-helix domain-containing tetratricopeptide repeat protein [Stellaceae bacterium]|nr:winged helix-turn-helix domain-containing tetratricopeptide repeat protein [Stellaceae bacterium]
MEFIFGDHRLDTERRELRRAGEPIPLQPQVFDLLVYLVRNRERVVSKDDLLAAVWGGRIVSESTLTSRINAVRKAIGDNGAAQHLIRTVPRRGIRFVGTVREEPQPAAADLSPAVVARALVDKPSIAVLPFANMTGDPAQDYFVDGMVEEIITALSRIRWLLVIARNSSFTYKGQVVDVSEIGRELGVRYVLEGSVRKAGERVRIAAQLIDAATDAHLWADRFDSSLADVFELQDQVAVSVAGVIEPALQIAETERLAGRRTDDLTAYDLYLRAYATFFSSATKIPEALCLLEHAVARDPHYGPALAWAAVCCLRLCMDGRSGDPQDDGRKAVDFARRALQVAGDDPGILANAALALAYFGEDIAAMTALADRALSLNPSFARGWYISGCLRHWAGHPELAIDHIETSLRLSPRARVGLPFTIIGATHFVSRRFDEAVPKLLFAIQEDPDYPPPYRYLAACYAQMGRLDDAKEVVRRLRAITRLVVPSFAQLRNPAHRELLLSGLRLAAGEALPVSRQKADRRTIPRAGAESRARARPQTNSRTARTGRGSRRQ